MSKVQTPLRQSPFFKKHRYSVFFFLFLVAYHVVVVNRFQPWRVEEITYAFHAVDFSLGLATKLLPGAVFNALFGRFASRLTASIYETVLILLFFAGVSIFLERFVLRVQPEHRSAALGLLAFYVTGAYTFSVYTKELGMLDVYWLFFSLLFLIFLEHKWLRFLIPLLYVASIMIHFSAILNAIIFFSIILLYRASIEQKKKERRIYLLIFALSMLVAAVSFLFFLVYEPRFICPIETFHQKLQEHGTDFFEYYDYAFYNWFRGEYYRPSELTGMDFSLNKIWQLILYQVRFNFDLMQSIGSHIIIAFIGGLVILFPLLLVFYKFLLQHLRMTNNRIGRFCALLMLLQFPFTFLVAILFSVDVNRWLTHGFLMIFTTVLLIMYYEKEKAALLLEKIKKAAGGPEVKLYYLGYAMIHVFAYF
ncbi:MAG: hypothetical protein IJU56_04535 [Clostridia bacterium]|nr:hypothetical protein [Clostridia bacterium]